MIREIASCNVVYVDKRVRQERIISHHEPSSSSGQREKRDKTDEQEHEEVLINTESLNSIFNSVATFNSGHSCVSTLNEISSFDTSPTMVLIDVPAYQLEDDDALDSDRHDSGIASSVGDDSLYGILLLRHISMEIDAGSISSNIIPIAYVASEVTRDGSSSARQSMDDNSMWTLSDEEQTAHMSKILDAGAMDVVASPFSKRNLKTLSTHCYRTAKVLQKRRSERKRSWVGVDADLEEEERQRKSNVRVAEGYAYLREKMVSELMRDIFKPSGPKVSSSGSKIRLSPARLELIKECIGRWDFSAHDFSDDELLQCAFEIFHHAFTMPGVEEWRIPPGQLTDFLYASRKAYNDQVPYHNFRHVVDVLQATFYFLLSLGALPHYTTSSASPSPKPHPTHKRPLSSIIRPFDALTLLIVAIGHDVGHPGVSNAFLVTLKAPLAQMYNDRSVLESFHCAAFSQVLRKHWPATQQGSTMRRLMIDSILATDMALHFDYMNQLEKLTKKLEGEDSVVDSWDDTTTSSYRSLLCTLLIKCADISNVARIDDVAAQWAMILTDEFSRQSSLETDLKIQSTLAVKPVKGSCLALARSQIGFIKLFAGPLFKAVADVMPGMAFGIEEIDKNLITWDSRIEECTANGDKPFVLQKRVRNYLPTQNGAQSSNYTMSSKTDDTGSPEAATPRMSNGAAIFGQSKRSSGQFLLPNSQPDSRDDRPPPVSVVVTGASKGNNGPSSPRSFHSQNERKIGNARGSSKTVAAMASDEKPSKHSQNPYLPQSSSQAHAVSATSLTPPSLTDSDDRPRSSPPHFGERLPKIPATIAVRHTRSKFNLNKLFRRRKTDATQPKAKIEL